MTFQIWEERVQPTVGHANYNEMRAALTAERTSKENA